MNLPKNDPLLSSEFEAGFQSTQPKRGGGLRGCQGGLEASESLPRTGWVREREHPIYLAINHSYETQWFLYSVLFRFPSRESLDMKFTHRSMCRALSHGRTDLAILAIRYPRRSITTWSIQSLKLDSVIQLSSPQGLVALAHEAYPAVKPKQSKLSNETSSQRTIYSDGGGTRC